ncbi:hypothetical protein [Stappia sp.]|jgi:hypothetical protein
MTDRRAPAAPFRFATKAAKANVRALDSAGQASAAGLTTTTTRKTTF